MKMRDKREINEQVKGIHFSLGMFDGELDGLILWLQGVKEEAEALGYYNLYADF